MGELLDILFFAVIAIYIVRSLARIFLPMFFQNAVNKAQQQGQQQQQQYTRNTSAGNIKVEYKPDAKKGTIPDSEGEFIDYEEVK